MKKRMPIISLILLGFTACSEIAPPPSLQSVIQAAENGVFVGIDKYTDASLEVTFRNRGPFSQISQLNFIIENGIYKDMQANLILAQYEATGEWEVIRLMVNKHGKWQVVPRVNQQNQ